MKIPLSLAAALLCLHASPANGAEPEKIDVFTKDTDGYRSYRIPSVIVTTKGTVLAFCEGRKTGSGDSGDIDLVLKRSTDGGRTFSPQQIVWDDAENTCGNPCPVVDRTTGTVWLLLTHNLGKDNEHSIEKGEAQSTRTVWVSHSTDDGVTWAKPVEITSAVKKPEWTWYATGPGAGIQTRKGRLVIPCDHRNRGEFSHVIYSDDHGKTWQLGGVSDPGGNECEVVELTDGKLLLNMRNYKPQRSSRAIANSDDGGLTWSASRLDPVLIEPTCQASLQRYSWPDAGKSRILFSNPAHQKKRENLTVRLSYDECQTWPESKVLHPGPSAYSSLAALPDGTAVCFYENGEKNPYEKITLARFGLDWLTDSRDPGVVNK
ncbi:MAG: exo-alpha-sialidase [Verrucomicrobiaceae bacterium]|nr:MAG: exo-alpha-sialidase [Verrucomicrobiaceae bacterium]